MNPEPLKQATGRVPSFIPNRHVSILAHDLLELLRADCVGREHARTIQRFVMILRQPRRKVELASEELRAAGIPLCSALDAPHGWYLARDFEEAKAWVHQIDVRFRSMAANRARAVASVKALAEGAGEQLGLDV